MALLICALLLLFFVNDTKYFSIILTIFSVVSIFGFWFYGKITNSIHKFNYSEYVQDKDKLHQFQSLLMNEYLRGKWTYYRAASLVFLLVPMDIICLYPNVASQVGTFINQRFSTVSQKSINDLIPVLSIIVFLVFAESWQWKKRIESNISINLLKNIISSI